MLINRNENIQGFFHTFVGMGIEIIKPSFSKAKPKATIHLSGKLGFNIQASNLMEMKSETAFHFAKDTDDDKKFYLITGTKEDGAAKVAKAGEYYYINLGDVFDIVGLNYKEETIIFDINKDTHNGKPMYVLSKRKPILRKKKN